MSQEPKSRADAYLIMKPRNWSLTKQASWPFAALLCACSVAVLDFIVLLSSGLGFSDALEMSGTLGVQVFAGVALVLLLGTGGKTSAVKLIALAIPIGMGASLISTVALIDFAPQGLAWMLPSIVLALIMFPAGRRKVKLSLPSWSGALVILVSSLPAYLACLIFWRQWPLWGESAFSIDGDLSVHESMANSLAQRGPGNSLAVLGGGIPYHWFADAWAGSLTRILDLHPFYSLTRGLYAATLLAGIAGIWCLATRLSRHDGARFLIALMAFGCAYLTTSVAHAGSLLFEPFSPSFQFGFISLLALSIVVLELLDRNISTRAIWLVAILSLLVAGGRTTLVLVLIGGLLPLLIVSILRRRNRLVTIGISTVVLPITAITALYLLRSPIPMSRLGAWRPQLNLDFPSMMGLIPWNSGVGYGMSVMAALVTVLLGASGCMWLFTDGHDISNAQIFCLGCGFTGVAGVFITQQAGYSHFSLLAAGSIFLYAASGSGVYSALAWLRKHHASNSFLACIAPFLILGGGIGILVVSFWPRIDGFRFSGVVRWLLPLAIACVLAAVAFASSSSRKLGIKGVLAIFIILGCTASFSVGVTSASVRLVRGSATVDASSMYVLNPAMLEAGVWAQRNLPSDAILATNRVCSLPDDVAPYCPSGVFTVSSLAKRQALIEGTSYGVSIDLHAEDSTFDWAVKRIEMSAAFGIDPNQSSVEYLWDSGVRFFWVDRSVRNAGTWEPFASVMFQNDSVQILQLVDPHRLHSS